MRRTIAVLMACLLTVSLASGLAEAPLQREETIYLEGNEETFLATQYTLPGQFVLWYADADFEPQEQEGGVRFALRNNFLDAEVHLDITRVDQPADNPEAALEQPTRDYQQDGWQVNPVEPDSFPLPNAEVAGFSAAKDNQIVRTYAVTLPSGLYLISMTYPMEAAEGWGARMFYFAMTLEPAI